MSRVALVLLVGCSAFDEQASPQILATECATVEQQLTTLTDLAESGGLDGLQQVLAEDLAPDLRRRLVHALLAIVDALPDGTFESLRPLADDGTLDDLTRPLGDLLTHVVGLGPPAYDALHQAGRMLTRCTGRPLLASLADTLRRPEVRADLDVLLSDDLDLVALLQELGVDLASLEEREGFQALVHNLVAVISQPDFDLEVHVGPGSVLDLVLDLDEPAVAALLDLARALLEPSAPRQSLQLVTRCLIQVDTRDQLAGMVFDLLRADLLESLPPLDLDDWPGGLESVLDDLLIPVLERLVADDAVRQSLVVVLDALLLPEVAARALPDVVTLVDSGALGEVVGLLSSLSTGACQ